MSDLPNGDDLPTYDSLAASEANTPNSRFGRWRDWVEKRANERALGSTPEQKLKRRKRGWGESTNDPPPSIDTPDAGTSAPVEELVNYSETLPSTVPYTFEDVPPKRLSAGERIAQSHASVHHFGSRFIPHAESPIHCVLSVMNDRYLILGTEDGLSVLDLLPALHGRSPKLSGGGHTISLGDARPIKLWIGESIHQLTLLEVASPGSRDTTPKGVILALVGVDSGNGEGRRRLVRMYNLSSICSLISFAVNQPESAKPLNLAVTATLQIPHKRGHRASRSITKGIRALVINDPSSTQSSPTKSRPNLNSPESPIAPSINEPSDPDSPASAGATDGWDMIEELPMRWATDYVPLAPTSKGTTHMDVTCFQLHQADGSRGRMGSILAVASRTSILIFEAPRGERAFRYVKELYTPFPVTHLQFVEQASPNSLLARHSEKSSRPAGHLGQDHRRSLRTPFNSRNDTEPILIGSTSQMALFVSFEKRAAVIRLSDAAVQEVTLYEEPAPQGGTVREPPMRQRTSTEGFYHSPIGLWLPSVSLRLPPLPPVLSSEDRDIMSLTSVIVLTKGKRTHILRSPLPSPLNATMPLVELKWGHQPSGVSARIIPDQKMPDVPWEGVVQLLGFGPEGVEVLEIPVSTIRARAAGHTARMSIDGPNGSGPGSRTTWGSGVDEPVSLLPSTSPEMGSPTSPHGKGKGRAKSKSLPVPPWDMPEPVRGYLDIGSDTTLLCRGGQWHDLMESGQSISRAKLTAEDIDSRSEEQHEAARELERDGYGVYACAYRGAGDFKVFYVGDFVEGDAEVDVD